MTKGDQRLIANLRTLSQRIEDARPVPAVPDIFTLASRSKLNIARATPEQLRQSIPATGTLLSFRRPFVWGTLAATAAAAALVLNLVLQKTNSIGCPPLADAGIALRAEPGASYSCSIEQRRLTLTLQQGVFILQFDPAKIPLEQRIVAISTTGDTLSITGTSFTVRIPNKAAQKYEIEMLEGHAALTSHGKTIALRAGRVYSIAANSLSEKPIVNHSPATNNPATSGPRVRITLYNGKQIDGWILKRGDVYTVQTASGILEIQQDDIQKENPL